MEAFNAIPDRLRSGGDILEDGGRGGIPCRLILWCCKMGCCAVYCFGKSSSTVHPYSRASFFLYLSAGKYTPVSQLLTVP